MLEIEVVAENTTEEESRIHIETYTEKCINTNIDENGVISPSCGLLWILLLKMLRGCIFTTVGISRNKI